MTQWPPPPPPANHGVLSTGWPQHQQQGQYYPVINSMWPYPGTGPIGAPVGQARRTPVPPPPPPPAPQVPPMGQAPAARPSFPNATWTCARCSTAQKPKGRQCTHCGLRRQWGDAALKDSPALSQALQNLAAGANIQQQQQQQPLRHTQPNTHSCPPHPAPQQQLNPNAHPITPQTHHVQQVMATVRAESQMDDVPTVLAQPAQCNNLLSQEQIKASIAEASAALNNLPDTAIMQNTRAQLTRDIAELKKMYHAAKPTEERLADMTELHSRAQNRLAKVTALLPELSALVERARTEEAALKEQLTALTANVQKPASLEVLKHGLEHVVADMKQSQMDPQLVASAQQQMQSLFAFLLSSVQSQQQQQQTEACPPTLATQLASADGTSHPAPASPTPNAAADGGVRVDLYPLGPPLLPPAVVGQQPVSMHLSPAPTSRSRSPPGSSHSGQFLHMQSSLPTPGQHGMAPLGVIPQLPSFH